MRWCNFNPFVHRCYSHRCYMYRLQILESDSQCIVYCWHSAFSRYLVSSRVLSKNTDKSTRQFYHHYFWHYHCTVLAKPAPQNELKCTKLINTAEVDKSLVWLQGKMLEDYIQYNCVTFFSLLFWVCKGYELNKVTLSICLKDIL